MGIETLLIGGATALSTFGALQKGSAEKQPADYNAAVAHQRAASERDAADAESSDFFRKEMRGVSAGQAARGATGVVGSEGSPLAVDEATVREVALGAGRIKAGGEVKGTRLEQEAQLYKMRGEAAQTASYLEAGKSLLTGGARFSGIDLGTGLKYKGGR